MGDSKVKVAVRIRPMNRRGENRARPGPPQQRRQVPGAPLRGGRPVGSGCPAPGVRIRAGGRPALPETLSSTRAPPVRDAPPLVCTASRGATGPTSRSAAPSAGASAPPRALSPSRFPLPFQEGALVPGPGLPSSSPHPFPWALASRVPAVALPAVSAAPAPSVSPLRPGRQPGTPKPHVTGPVALTLHFGGSRQGKWQGVWSTPPEKAPKCKHCFFTVYSFTLDGHIGWEGL